MCAPAIPAIIGIGAAVAGTVGSIASFQQQRAQADAANAAARQQQLLSNINISRDADFNLQQAAFNTEIQNQNTINANNQLIYNSILRANETVNSNLLLNQQYLSQLNQRNYGQLNQRLDFAGRLNQYRLSKQASRIAQKLSDSTLSSELEDAQRRLREAAAEASFASEELLASNIKATGTLLATGKAGQSIGLELGSIEGAYARDYTQIGRNFEIATEDFYQDTTNAYLRDIARDAEAKRSVLPKPVKPIPLPKPPAPVFAQMPDMPPLAPLQTDLPPLPDTPFQPAPVKQPGPSPLGLVANIGSSVIGGIGQYQAAGGLIKQPGAK